MSDKPVRSVPIAIVGVAALMPGADGTAAFWNNVVTGKDLMIDVPRSHWLIDDHFDPNPLAADKTYCKRGAFLPDVDFDPMEFGIPPNSLAATDPSQLLALYVAKRLIDDVTDGDPTLFPKDRTSVILGLCGALQSVTALQARLQRPVWALAMREAGLEEAQIDDICARIKSNYIPWQEASFPGLLNNVVAGRIANRFDLHGTNMSTDAACASSLAAVQVAVNELALGQSDLAITGGVDTLSDAFAYLCFSKTPALSPTGDCRPFSDNADGTMMGEGLVMFALKRLADAEREGNRVYAVLKGIGASSDGRHKSIYAPRPEGQAIALERCYEAAGYGPETVELVEAHGTGTKAGDVAEVASLKSGFQGKGVGRTWCALGSVKSQLGHTKGAAGVAGLLKIVLALHHKVLPPTIKVDRPNPALGLDGSPFYLNTRSRPWIRDGRHPRRASVSSFGFGGTNFHVTAEEYEPAGAARPAWTMPVRPTELLLFSAATTAELTAGIKAALGRGDDLRSMGRLGQIAFRASDLARLALTAESRDDATAKLDRVVAALQSGQTTLRAPGLYLQIGAANPGSVAFLFPGQGSQYAGMGADLAMAFVEARRVWDAAPSFGGVELHALTFPRPVFTDEARAAHEAALTATEWAQPAIGAASLAALAVLGRMGLRADCVAGHSFGELTALTSAGALSADALLLLARRRGELMQAASETSPGAMLSVRKSAGDVNALIQELALPLVIANHNGPNEVVVSGGLDAIASIEQALTRAGAVAKRLPVAAAFHSPAVASAVDELAAFLQDVPVAALQTPLYGSADAALYEDDAGAIRHRVAAQLALPVRFADTIEAMYARGVRVFVEVGPGAVLTDLVGRCLGDRPHLAVETDRKGRSGVTSLNDALARLAVAGVALDLAALAKDEPAPTPPPAKRVAGVVRVNGTSYGKLYPPRADAPRAAPKKAPEVGAARPEEAPRANVEPASDVRATPPPAHPAPAPAAVIGAGRAAGPAPSAPRLLTETPWIAALQEAERRTAETHSEFQRALAQAHTEYLKVAGDSLRGIMALAAGQAPGVALAAPHPPAPYAVPPSVAAPLLQPSAADPSTERAIAVSPPTSSTPTPSSSAPPALDLRKLLLGIVAEKTGYEESLLGMQMDLEADLGIDSIKRVEILAALRDQVPSLPDVQPSEVASLRTLEAVDAYLVTKLASMASIATSAAPAPAPAAPAAAAPAAETVDLRKLLLSIVAEKTGYEESLLGMDMDLEADLGIDSIKRVEILAALRDQVPSLPDVQPSEVASLRTLKAVDAFLTERLANIAGGSPDRTPEASSPPVPAEAKALRRGVAMIKEAACGLAIAGLRSSAEVVITEDRGGVAQALESELKRRGMSARVVVDVPSDAQAVVFLGGLRDVASSPDAMSVNREAFRVAKVLAPTAATSVRVFVTVQDTGGDFGLSGGEPTRAWLGGVAALTRTVGREWPETSVKAIDCERGTRTSEEIAGAIAGELLGGGSSSDVGLGADGTRTVRTLVDAPIEAGGEGVIDARSVVVATGGGRGVTAASLVALARAHRPRIAILGRTALREEPACCAAAADEPTLRRALVANAEATGQKVVLAEVTAKLAEVLANREVRATLAALQAAGSDAIYLDADARDAAALAQALEQVRAKWGEITAIVHGAGVLADKRLEQKSEEQYNRVFDTKVLGLAGLLAATARDPLTWICLFSSSAAHSGNVGQADYAMANEVLNHVAAAEQARRGRSCVVSSIGWGPWHGGMVTPELARHFERLGVPLLSVEAGGQAFVAETARAPRSAVVVLGPVIPLPDRRALKLDVHVSAASHPYLEDHAVAGVPVVPMVLVVEWFLRAAKALEPNKVVTMMRKVRVQRGLRLTGFVKGEHFTIRIRTVTGGGTADLELVGANGAVHYSATVVFASVFAQAPAAASPPADLVPIADDQVYDGHALFHGPRFQVLRSVGLTRQGGAAEVVGVLESTWPAEVWQIDPAAFDGAAQLTGLCATLVLGGATLPMAIDEVSFHRSGALSGPLRATAIVQALRTSKVIFEMTLSDSFGRVVVAGRGLEMLLRPDPKPEPHAAAMQA